MNTKTNIDILKAYAEANYNNGMDTLVECYDTAEWQELLDDSSGDVDEAKKLMDELAEVFRDRQADARNSAY